MTPKNTQLLAKYFFNELIDGKPTSADKTLQKIKSETRMTDWQKGYLNALEGMLTASGSKNDKSILFNQVSAKEADKLTKEFTRRAKNKMQSEFDRGFLEAWADYVKILKDSSQTLLKT